MHYDLLVVPGGWATQKWKALSKSGRDRIKLFVNSGGSFLGFCGGAGLGLDVECGLSLLKAGRKISENRLVNFSGSVFLLQGDSHHPLWQNLKTTSNFYVWWPSQFEIKDSTGIKVLARYDDAATDFRVSDISVEDMKLWGKKWEEWESVYRINLNPEIIRGEPAIIEGKYGLGRVVLSYVHLDTPNHQNSQVALKNISRYLCDSSSATRQKNKSDGTAYVHEPILMDTEIIETAHQINNCISGFYNFGYRNLLWNWRTPWLLHWKRGLRGLEYTTLLVMTRELTGQILDMQNKKIELSTYFWKDKLFKFKMLLDNFVGDAYVLLGKERFISEKFPGPLSKLKSPDEEVRKLRNKLFGDKMLFGGEFRKLVGILDELLFAILKCKNNE